MKYSIAASLLLGSVVNAAKVVNNSKLLKGARPLLKNGRKLDQEWEITGDYSIQFSQCVSFKTFDEDLFDEDLYQYAYDKTVVAEKSFVIFNVCKTQYCDYEAESMQFITELGTYMNALVEYIPNQKEEFCQECQEFEDYCNGGQNQNQGDEDEDEGDRRKLQNYINCNKCQANDCFAEDQDQDDAYIGDEDIIGWVQEMAECKNTEYQMNGLDLSVGFICNSYGTGVEIGVFLDDDCAIYYPDKSFADVMDYDDSSIYPLSSEYVTYPFKNDIDCASQVEYDDPYEDNQDNNNNDEEENEANEVCRGVFDETVDLDTCGGEYQEQQEYNEQAAYYEWYEYDIDGDGEIADVCFFVQEWDTEQYEAVFSEEASGSFYDYTPYESQESQSSGGSLSAGWIAGIALIVVAVIVAAFVGYKYMAQNKEDSKKEPLTSSGGAVA